MYRIETGWIKDKEKIEEISRQRSSTVSGYLESVKRLSVAPPYRASVVVNYSSHESNADANASTEGSPAAETTSPPPSQQESTTAQDERSLRAAPLGTISGLIGGEAEMSAKEVTLWKRLENQVVTSEAPERKDGTDHESEVAVETTIEDGTYQSTSERQERERAVVLYDFVSQSDEELDMAAGDVVEVWERSNGEWWFGTVNGRDFGFFPKNYVQLLGDGHH